DSANALRVRGDVRDGRQPAQVALQDGAAPLDQRLAQVALAHRVVFSDLDGGLDQRLFETGQNTRHPGAVGFGHAHERGVRILAAPGFGVEVARAEIAENAAGEPGSLPQPLLCAERHEIFGDVAGVENVRVAKAARNAVDGPLAAEAVAHVDDVV